MARQKHSDELPFSSHYNFVARSGFTTSGVEYKAGDEFNKGDVTTSQLEKLWRHRRIKPRAFTKKELAEIQATKAVELRQDGPLIDEWAAAGYLVEHYPPEGYESRSTAEEIAAAQATQDEQIAERARLAQEAANAELAKANSEDGSDEPVADKDTVQVDALKYHKEHRGGGNWFVVNSFDKSLLCGPFKKDTIDAELAKANTPAE